MRHPYDPSRYLLSRSRAPELVEVSDIMDFALDGTPVGDTKMQPYLERFIHGAIYEARPDVMAVVHAHAEDTLPFGIAGAQKTDAGNSLRARSSAALCRCGISLMRLAMRRICW